VIRLCSSQQPFRRRIRVATAKFDSLAFGFRIILQHEILRFTSKSLYLLCPPFSLPSFLPAHPSTIREYLCVFCLPTHQYTIITSNIFLQQRSSFNKHNPHQTHHQQAIMSDAPDSTFTAGETKLLISIIKNLTGDLQVCLLSFLYASFSPAFPFHIAAFGCVLFSNAVILHFSLHFFPSVSSTRLTIKLHISFLMLHMHIPSRSLSFLVHLLGHTTPFYPITSSILPSSHPPIPSFS
jgi:hypothetical protein